MNIIYGFLYLCFLIFFHELGHFLAAKLSGVTVLSFSIGFGPVILHKKIKSTDYRISLFPLGGYCGMKGEKDFAKSLEMKLDFIDASPDSIWGIHPLKRAVIAAAGPFFNILFAAAAFSIISISGYTYYSYSSKINIPENLNKSPARDSGILSGDIITEINGKKIENFSDIIKEISLQPDKNINIQINRNGKILFFSVHTDFDKKTGSGKIGVSADLNSLEKYHSKKYSLFPAVLNGIKETGNGIYMIFKSFTFLIKGADLKSSLSGPLRTADILGSTTESFSEGLKTGIADVLNFTAIISISLGIMNLLPLPVLDGGMIVFAITEWVLKRKINPKVFFYMQFVGIFLIIFIASAGISSDIIYFINNLKRGIK